MRRTHALATTIVILGQLAACSGGGNDPQPPAEDAALTGESGAPTIDASLARDGARADAGTPGCAPACGPKQVCVAGSCKDLPSQCPCPIESYCDLTTNQCVPGCMSDADCQQGRYCDAARTCREGCRVGSCPSNEVCSLATRICECTSGYHRCKGSCVKEGIASCGPACEVCPTDPFGTTSCAATGCQLSCKSGYKMCGGSCAACPTEKASSFACSGKSSAPPATTSAPGAACSRT